MPKLLAWIVYVRWQSGQREAIRCTAPDEMIKRDGVWVMAWCRCRRSPWCSVGDVAVRPGRCRMQPSGLGGDHAAGRHRHLHARR